MLGSHSGLVDLNFRKENGVQVRFGKRVTVATLKNTLLQKKRCHSLKCVYIAKKEKCHYVEVYEEELNKVYVCLMLLTCNGCNTEIA